MTDGDDTCGTRTGTTERQLHRPNEEPDVAARGLLRRGALPPHRRGRARLVGPDLRHRLRRGLHRPTTPTASTGSPGAAAASARGCPASRTSNWQTDSEAHVSSPKRAQCTTCTDAFVAPDAATLADAAPGDHRPGRARRRLHRPAVDHRVGLRVRGPASPGLRRPPARRRGTEPSCPTRFVSSFTLPGFKGQLRAYQNDGTGVDNSVQMWSAGDKLRQLVTFGGSNRRRAIARRHVLLRPTAAGPGRAGQCVLSPAHERASHTHQAAHLHDRAGTASTRSPRRRSWPAPRPTGRAWPGQPPGWRPVCAGRLHEPRPRAEHGAPAQHADRASPNVHRSATCDPATTTNCRRSRTTSAGSAPSSDELQGLPGHQPAQRLHERDVNTKMQAARREARDIILAFMAGAATVPDSAAPGSSARPRPSGSSPRSSLLYKARDVGARRLGAGDARRSSTPPSLSEPEATPYVDEYKLYRDGPRDASGKNVDTAGDADPPGLRPHPARRRRTMASDRAPTPARTLKPVMTVVYAPANDMLHAFRAGPELQPGSQLQPRQLRERRLLPRAAARSCGASCPTTSSTPSRLRAANEPQGRANHVFMLARGDPLRRRLRARADDERERRRHDRLVA